MPNDPRSHGLWARTAPPAPSTGPLADERAVDVAVVGGGFTGASAALHLSQGGASVGVLEAAEIGFGGSGRNVGLLNAGLWVMPQVLRDTLGPVYGDRLLTLLGEAPRAVMDIVAAHGIACEIEAAGTIHCGVGRRGLAELTERAAQWQALGAPVRLLDAAETASMTGTAAYAGALLDRRAGTIQPLAYVRGLTRAAMTAGAQVFTGSPALSAARSDGRWRVATPGGSLTARWLVMATEVYAHGLFPEIAREQVRLPYFNIATAPLGDNVRRTILPGRQGAWDTRTILSHFRLDQAGRLVVGGVGALRGAGTGIHRAWARRYLRRLFPQLGPVAFEAEWYGIIGMTDDHLPRLHLFGDEAIGISGYNGRGIAPGTVFGRALAHHILGQTTLADMPLPVTPVGAAAFRPAKEAWYEIGAQIAHLPPGPL